MNLNQFHFPLFGFLAALQNSNTNLKRNCIQNWNKDYYCEQLLCTSACQLAKSTTRAFKPYSHSSKDWTIQRFN